MARGRGRGGGGNAAGAHCVLIEQPSSTEFSSADKTRTRIAPPSSFITSHTERGPAGGGEYDDERWARNRCAAPKLAMAVPSAVPSSGRCAPLSERRGCSRPARGGLGGAPAGASLMHRDIPDCDPNDFFHQSPNRERRIMKTTHVTHRARPALRAQLQVSYSARSPVVVVVARVVVVVYTWHATRALL